MTNRIHIDAPTGVIEVEGEKDFVEAQLDKLLPLIQSCGFGTRPAVEQKNNGESLPSLTTNEEQANEEGIESAANGAPKRSRRGKSRAPKGQSCADRILTLKSDGYFKKQRSPSDIVEALGEKGWTHKSNQVSAALVNMFERNDIQRTKSGRGFLYFWDRD